MRELRKERRRPELLASGLLALAVLLLLGEPPLPAAAVDDFAAVLRAAASPAARPSDGADEVAPPETAWRSVPVDGVARRYLVSVPSRTGPAPLVLAFHGLGQRAGSFAGLTGLVPATRAAGEVLALPETQGPAFNDGRLGGSGPDDETFALAVIGQLAEQGLVDPRRVVVTGFSNGAGMAMALAATHPHAVAALVAVGGALIDAPGAPRPTAPVPVCLVHGTADAVQPWTGRRAAGPLWPAYISQPATVAEWVRVDGAGREGAQTLPGRNGGGAVTVRSWAPGPAGAGVTFYAVEGMGHRWPSPSRPAEQGSTAEAIDATGIVVDTAAHLRAATGS